MIATASPAKNWKAAGKDELKLELGIGQASYPLEIRNTPGALPTVIELRPNSPSKTILGFSYRNIGLSYGFTNTPEPELIERLGETKSSDLSLRFIGRHSFEFSNSKISGYYIDNSQDLDPTYAGSPNRIKRSDVSTSNFNFNYLYNFDHEDFSFTAFLNQTDRHTSSGWGRFFFAGYDQYEVNSTEALLPTDLSAPLGEIGRLQTVQRKVLFAGLGLGGILSSGKWYLGGILGVGPSLKEGKAVLNGLGEEELPRSGTFQTVRLGLGYNGELHVFGLQIIANGGETPIRNGSLFAQNTDTKVFYAYRFKGVNVPPLNFVSDIFDW